MRYWALLGGTLALSFTCSVSAKEVSEAQVINQGRYFLANAGVSEPISQCILVDDRCDIAIGGTGIRWSLRPEAEATT